MKLLSRLVAITLLPLGFAVTAPVHGQEKEPDRAADKAAVRGRCDAFLKALVAGSAKEVAAFWTTSGEYARGDDLTIRGRGNIEKAYAEHFKKKPAAAVAVEEDSIRFLADDTAVQEGVFVVKRPNPADSARNHFSALWVRYGGQWHFGLLREAPEAASLQDLAWLVGNWAFSSKESETRMTVEWTEGKTYLLCRVNRKDGDDTSTATQILAVHPITRGIQSWTFESDGSLGQAVWTRNDKGWSAKITSATADGDKVTATTVLTPIDDNTFVFETTDRTIDGEKTADVGPFKVTRVVK